MAHHGKAVAVLLGAFVLGAAVTESSAAQIGTAGIMNNAITTPKIKNLAVTNAKIGNLAVTSGKIGNLAVTSGKIASEAVTPDKISFYRNVIIVAPTGGDFTSPVAALASITNASESNPYMVKLMPGTYNIGGDSVIMKSHVVLEGSGEMITFIGGTVSTSLNGIPDDPRPLYGVVTMADESQVQFLTVINSGAAAGSKCVAAILARDTDATITHVRAMANGTNCNVGIAVNITQADSDRAAFLMDTLAFADWRA